MRTSRRSRLLLPALLASLLVAGCARNTRNAAAELPPPPEPDVPSPPEILPQLGSDPTQTMVSDALARATYTEETTAILDEAERYFQAGRGYFERGDAENARRSFDMAIDVLLDAPLDAWDRFRVAEKAEELMDAIHAHEVEGLASGAARADFAESPLDDVLAVTFPVDPSIELDVHAELKLPVSELPLEINDAVMRYVNYFQTEEGREVLVEGLQRQGRYRAMIQRILDEEGIPQELIFLAQAESGFKPRALSRRLATGMWQFMRLPGRQYGLNRTSDYDDRLDPEKSTRAAARYLRDLYERHGDWYLAMAAYNAGPTRVDRAVRYTGYADFWEFYYRKALPLETRNYVPIVLAMVIMAKYPAEYGLENVQPDPPIEYNTTTVSGRTHLGLIADILDLPLDKIRELNPAILRDVAPDGYTVRIPKGTANRVLAALEAIPADRRDSWRIHRVMTGETLDSIAKTYNTSVESIALANGGVLRDPEAGDLVVIPVSYQATSDVRRQRDAGDEGIG